MGCLVRRLLLEGRTFEEISLDVIKNFPVSRFNKKHLRWYRNRLYDSDEEDARKLQ
jgi:hypothetical protein